jgi:hypothetical protein
MKENNNGQRRYMACDESYFQNIRETALQDTIEQLTKEIAETQALVERKDALIDKMRDALRAWMRTPNIPFREAIKLSEAALEAAERGE